MNELTKIASQYSRNSGNYAQWRLALASSSVINNQIQRSSNRQLLATEVSTAILASGMNRINKNIVFSVNMLNATISNGFDQVNTNLDKISSDLGQMSNLLSFGFGAISGSIQKMSKEICTKLDDIHATLKNPVYTKARELYLRSEGNYKKGFFEEALADVDESINLNKTDYISWFLKGHIYLFGAGEFCNIIDPAKAEESFLNAAKYISPDVEISDDARKLASEIYYYLAYSRYILSNEAATNNSEKAKEYLENAITAAKKSFSFSDFNHEALYLTCKCFILSEDKFNAIGALRKLFELNAIYSIKVLDDSDFSGIEDDLNILIKELSNNIRPEASTKHKQIKEIADSYEFYGGPYSDSIEPKIKTCLTVKEVNSDTAYYDMWIICKLAPDIVKDISIKEFPCDRLVCKKQKILGSWVFNKTNWELLFSDKLGEIDEDDLEALDENNLENIFIIDEFFSKPYKGMIIMAPSSESAVSFDGYEFGSQRIEEITQYSKFRLAGIKYNYNSLKGPGNFCLAASDLYFGDSRLRYNEASSFFLGHWSLEGITPLNPANCDISATINAIKSPGRTYGFKEEYVKEKEKFDLYFTNTNDGSVRFCIANDINPHFLGYLDKQTLLLINSEKTSDSSNYYDVFYVYQVGIAKKEKEKMQTRPAQKLKTFEEYDWRNICSFDPYKLHEKVNRNNNYNFAREFKEFETAIAFVNSMPEYIEKEKNKASEPKKARFDKVKNEVYVVRKKIQSYYDKAKKEYEETHKNSYLNYKDVQNLVSKIGDCIIEVESEIITLVNKISDANMSTVKECVDTYINGKREDYIRKHLGNDGLDDYRKARKNNDKTTIAHLQSIADQKASKANKEKLHKIGLAIIIFGCIAIYMIMLRKFVGQNMAVTCVSSAATGFISFFMLDRFFNINVPDELSKTIIACICMSVIFLIAGWILYFLGPLTKLLAGLILIACPIVAIITIIMIITDSY